MPINVKPLTKRQLIECFTDYRGAFPDWTVEHDVVLTRSEGPLKQHIAFEALRSGAYRPSCSVEVLVTLEVRILFCFLDIKHREVYPREHLAKWPGLVRAMEEQFQPPVRNPLDVLEVFRLEEEAVVRDRIENVNHFCALAALGAFLGYAESALLWCDRAERDLKNQGHQPAEWELRQAQFARRLREAIEAGQAELFLRSVKERQYRE
jgi:hypothetical protein